MLDDTLFEQLPSNVTIVRNAKLADYTTFRLGGACPALIDCPDAQSLTETAQLLHRQSIPFIVVGQGSNLHLQTGSLTRYLQRFPRVLLA